MLTIQKLYEHCEELIKNGQGDRIVLLCVNDKDFYPLNFEFSSPVYNNEAVYEKIEELNLEEDNVIVLN